MKHFYTTLTAVLSVVLGISAQEGQPPVSWAYFDAVPSINLVELPSLDLERVQQEDLEKEAAGGMTNNGRVVFSSHSMANEGQWTTLEDGSRICRMGFRSDGALALDVYFEQFYMPAGAALFAYDPQMSYWVGPMTDKENDEHRRFVTGQVFGDEIILEYYEPANTTEQPLLEVLGVGNFYRYIYNYSQEDDSRGGSDPCEVDVACPEGNDWQAQKDAVVRLQITDNGQIGLCSGVMMNTTAGDFRQYLLSALHCADGTSDADLNFLQVKFNFERPLCGSGFYPQNRNKTGVVRLADSNDGGGASGSDFVLFEVEDYIDDGWNPYFAGWRSSTSTSPSGVSIHHPAGDIKKISTYTDNLVSVWVGAPGSHWSVEWAPTVTNHGVTEGGSSGSPIFDNNKYVVGTLTGGGSYCSSPFANDYYGKMSYHFTGNPNPASEKLKLWLDPANTNQNTLTGSYRDGSSTSVVEAESLTPELFPNPVSDVLNIRLPQGLEVERIELHNSIGQLVYSENVNANVEFVDMNEWPSGIYIVSIVQKDGRVITSQVARN